MNAYELTLKDQRDYKNTIDYAVDKAIEKTASKLIKKGIDLFTIQEVTGLSMDMLQRLQSAI
jgi:hypothetical protein